MMKKKHTFLALAMAAGSMATGNLHAQDASITLGTDGSPMLVQFTGGGSYRAAQGGSLMEQHLGLGRTDKMELVDQSTDGLGYEHLRFQQTYMGIPVEYGRYTAHLRGGQLVAMNGEFKRVEGLSVVPVLTERAAFAKAKAFVGADAYAWEDGQAEMPKGELVVVQDYSAAADKDRFMKPVLAYKFDIYATSPIRRDYVYVDARDGRVVHVNPIIKHADNFGHGSFEGQHGHEHFNALPGLMAPQGIMAAGSAATRYSGTQTIQTTPATGGHALRDNTRGNGINTYNCATGTRYVNTDFIDNDNNWSAAEWNNAAKDNGALDAHWGAEMTYDYWMQKHSRNSWDGNGAAINSYVHYDRNYDNAFWNGSVMTYGDGSTFDILTSMDVVAHEIGHAVCEKTANLVYSYESGAMNEGFSDIWGACVEAFSKNDNNLVWEIGEEIGTSPLRSMSNPNSQNQPDTYKGTMWYSGTGDNGGVHYNSGVLNYWFYLLSAGGSGTNDFGTAFAVPAIGIDDAAKIAYRLESVYLTSNSQYADAKTYGLLAAADIFGSSSQQYASTQAAFVAIGLITPAIETCDGNISLSLTTDKYGSETSWTLKKGTTTIQTGSGYGNNTTYNFNWSLAAGDYTFTINDSYGDGMCCAYGNGGYALADGCRTFKTGGSIGKSETVNFTVVTGTAPNQAPTAKANGPYAAQTGQAIAFSSAGSTDADGTIASYAWNFGDGTTSTSANPTHSYAAAGTFTATLTVTDDDGATATSNATVTITAPTGGGTGGTVTLHATDFEAGSGIWIDGGTDASFYTSGTYAYSASRALDIQDNSGVPSSFYTNQDFNLTSYASVKVEFVFYAVSMETGEDFWLQYFNGSTWQTVGSWAAGTSFNNNTFYSATVELAKTAYNFPANAEFRFVCDASDNNDDIYIDNVVITATSQAIAGVAPTSGATQTTTFLASGIVSNTLAAEEGAGIELSVFPNPATDLLVVDLGSQTEATVQFFNAAGSMVMEQDIKGSQRFDMAQLPAGLYLVRVQSQGETLTSRVVKQ